MFLIGLLNFLRPSDISRIRLSSHSKHENFATLQIPDPKERKPKTVWVNKYEDDAICPYLTLLNYLERTKELRANSCDKLFISTRNPYSEASATTISRWLKNSIRISTSELTARSIRSSAATLCLDKGTSIEVVTEIGNWSSDSMFWKHYKAHSQLTQGRLNMTGKLLK